MGGFPGSGPRTPESGASSESHAPHWSYEATQTAFSAPRSRPGGPGRAEGRHEPRGGGPGHSEPRGPVRPAGTRALITPVSVGVVVLALVVGAGTAWLVQRGASEKKVAPSPSAVVNPDGRSGDSEPSAPVSQGASPSEVPSPPSPLPSPPPSSPSEVPAGYVVTKDPAAIELAVPRGWVRESDNANSVVYYRPPVGGRTQFLQFWPISEVGHSSRELLGITMRNRSQSPGYELVSLSTLPGARHAETEELVFEYDSAEAGRRLRLVEWVFRAGDGQQYAFLGAGAEGDWPQQRRLLGTVVDFFALPGADAP